MAEQKVEIDVLVLMMEFVEMFSKNDEAKQKEIAELFEKESGFKLPIK